MDNPALRGLLLNKFHKVKMNGEWFNIPCPTCPDRHHQAKMRRYVHASGLRNSNCFICKKQLSMDELLGSDLANAQIYSYELDRDDAEPAVDPRALKLPYSKSIPVNELDGSHPAIKFLHKDYLFDLDKYAKEFGIVYVPFEGGEVLSNGRVLVTSAERLVFPVLFNQKLVGWQMRTVPGTFYGDKPDAIRYYHVFPKGHYLYNFDNARKHKRVVVVEGVKKALKFDNAVATWGTGISRNQLKLIQDNWEEIIVMLDADKDNDTQARAREFVAKLNYGNCRAINVNLADYGDIGSPDDLPSDLLKSIVEVEWSRQS